MYFLVNTRLRLLVQVMHYKKIIYQNIVQIQISIQLGIVKVFKCSINKINAIIIYYLKMINK